MSRVSIVPLSTLRDHRADVIVNCIGAGDPGRIGELGAKLMTLTETYDKMLTQ